MIYEIKNTTGAVTDVDMASNRVTGYASVFGNKDSDRDIILPGSFTKSLSESGSRVLHLYQHDSYRPLSSVKSGNLKLSEDPKGLKFESTITPTSWGKDVMLLIQDKVLNENSIGFQVVKSQDKQGYRELSQLKLFEISSVSWAANPLATNDVKSLYATDEFLTARLETVTKAFRNGSYTDETFGQLEIYLLQLNQLLLESKSTQHAAQAAAMPVVDEKVIQRIKAWNLLMKPKPKAADPMLALAGRLKSRFATQN